MAREWRMPPWDIVWDKGKTLWVLRYRVWYEVTENARKEKSKHNKK